MEKPVVLKSSINYNQPSLPFLLSNYGFGDGSNDEKQKEKDNRKEKQAKKQKKKTSSFDDGEDEKALMRAKEKEEHYLKLVKDLYRLRDYYYNEYSSLLGEKVQKQRREIRERDNQRQRQKEKEEEEKRIASHMVKKRLERHTLETTPSTAHVPKTDLYHIIGLEDKLRREGKLKTPSDYNKFREEMDEPTTFFRTFKVKKTTDLHSYPSSMADHVSNHSRVESQDNIFSMAPTLQIEEQGQRSLSRISESREPSRTGFRPDHWAITQQYPAMYKQKRRSIHAGRKSIVDSLNDLDRRFPKLEMPKLHCFTMDLAKKPPDPEEVQQQAQLRAREKERKKAIRTYTKMYQLAMSNAAVSNRIMDQHEDMDMIINGPDLCDVIADHHWMTAYGLREVLPQDLEENQSEVASLAEQPEDHDKGENQGRLDSSGQSRENSATSSQRSSGSRGGSRQASAKSQKTLPEIEPKPAPLPLTMTEITDKCNIMEAKTLSTLWSNYLRAGK
ncbi:hypothetical protein PoB_001122200 [Plakobranchus ocellatus]|uniref:Uncharacterized protein n=1 Tax=Plakobranchus ocellatus TaxID=259542 RepID=A0AAV3YQH5_9GAST|nr:hypothetical protein PoB_001122200 [Plakobranchus ocellatus]